MKKVKLFLTTLCLITTLTFAVPIVAYAEDGPQGTSNSAPKPPPPPPPPSPTLADLLWALIRII